MSEWVDYKGNKNYFVRTSELIIQNMKMENMKRGCFVDLMYELRGYFNYCRETAKKNCL
jgi:hypothetical protein